MRRLGLVWRVALIVIAALATMQMGAAAAYYIQRSRVTDSGFRLPLPDQVAALIQLVEHAPADERSLALRIANGAGLRVAIEPQAPPEPDPLQPAPWIEIAVAQYLGESRADGLRAYYIGAERDRSILQTLSIRPIRIVYPLAGGGVLVVETADELTVRVLGLPPGYWAGIVGFAAAALALYAVVRETSPLARLARSVERFGEAIEPAAVPERGAREVRALTAAFNRMQSRIAELVRGRTFILAELSHGLATYLTRLRAWVEMASDAASARDARHRGHEYPAGRRTRLRAHLVRQHRSRGRRCRRGRPPRMRRTRGGGWGRARATAGRAHSRGGRARRARAGGRQPHRQCTQIWPT